jgi:hypothetical protein
MKKLMVFLFFILWQDSVLAERPDVLLQEALQSIRELKKEMRSQDERIRALETENKQLRSHSENSVPDVPPNTASVTNLSAFNPEIGLIGDFVASSSSKNEDEEGNDSIQLRSMELVLGHDVDPYSRFDAAIAFSDEEGPEVEEAYLTHHALPFGTLGKVGRVKPKIGITPGLHRDQLDTINMPLVVRRYFGEEGLSKTGVELSNFLPVSWVSPSHEVVAGVLQGGAGEGGTIVGDSRRTPTFYARLKNGFEFGEADSLHLGATFIGGSTDADQAWEARTMGFDLAYRHPLSPTSGFRLQSELYLQDRETADFGESESEEVSDTLNDPSPGQFRHHPMGYYFLADYRLNGRWAVGGRWDWTQPVNVEVPGAGEERGVSTYLTFHQSEYARWRFQYERAEDAVEDSTHIISLQGTFAIGVHKHNIQ